MMLIVAHFLHFILFREFSGNLVFFHKTFVDVILKHECKFAFRSKTVSPQDSSPVAHVKDEHIMPLRHIGGKASPFECREEIAAQEHSLFYRMHPYFREGIPIELDTVSAAEDFGMRNALQVRIDDKAAVF